MATSLKLGKTVAGSLLAGVQVLGSVVINPERTWFYIPIPKVGTTSLRKTFTPWRATDDYAKIQPPMPGFALIRNPVDRWFSGVHEYSVNSKIPVEELLETARRGSLVFDNHTRPQVEYVVHDVQLIKLDHASEWIKETFGVEMAWKRRRKWEYQEDLIQPVLELYSADMALWDNAS